MGGRGRGRVRPRVPAPSLDTERMAGSCSLPSGGVSLEPPHSHVVIHLLSLVGGHGTLFGRLLRSLAWIFPEFWFGCLLPSL